MKREELLRRSKKERNNEYEDKIFNESQRIGIFVIIGICIIFFIANAIVSDIKGLEMGIASFDYPAILFAYLAGVNVCSYVKSKNKNSLIYAIAFTPICIVMVSLYFVNL